MSEKKLTIIIDAVNKSQEQFQKLVAEMNKLRTAQKAEIEQNKIARQSVANLARTQRDLAKAMNQRSSATKGATASSKANAAATDKQRKTTDKTKASTDKFTDAMHKLQAAVVIIAIRRMVEALIEANIQFQRINNALVGVFGSSQMAAQEFEYVKGVATELGLDLGNLADRYSKIVAAGHTAGFATAEIKDIFEAISETSVVLGMSMDDVRGALRAVEQMMSKGNVQAEELRGQLGERLPGALGLAARGMKVSTRELNKMLDNGEVLAKDLLPALAVELRKNYGKGLAQALEATARKIDRFKTSLFLLQKAAGDTGFMNVFGSLLSIMTAIVKVITEVLLVFKDMWSTLEQLSPTTAKLVSVLGGAIAVAALVAVGIAAVTFAVIGLKAAFIALTAAVASSGIGLILIAIGFALGAAFLAYDKFVSEPKRKAKAMEKQLEAINSKVEEIKYNSGDELIKLDLIKLMKYERTLQDILDDLDRAQKLDDIAFDANKANAGQTNQFFNNKATNAANKASIEVDRLQMAMAKLNDASDPKQQQQFEKHAQRIYEVQQDLKVSLARIERERQQALKRIRDKAFKEEVAQAEFWESGLVRSAQQRYERGEITLQEYYAERQQIINDSQTREEKDMEQSEATFMEIQRKYAEERIALEEEITQKITAEAQRRVQARQFELQQADAYAEMQLSQIDADPRATNEQKEEAKIPILARQNELIGEQIALIQTQLALSEGDPSADAQLLRMQQMQELTELQQQYLENDIAIQESSRVFLDEIGDSMIDYVDSLGTAAERVAGIIQNTLNTAISSVAQNLTDLIFRTKSWEEAWQSVVSAVVKGLVQMLIQFAVQQAAMFLIRKIWGKAAVTAAATEATAMTAMWSAPATAASIATFGAAAGVGTAAYIAALGAGIAAGTAMSGVAGAMGAAGAAEGGRIPGPNSDKDNLMALIDGKKLFQLATGEYVVRARNVDRNLQWLRYANNGGDIGAMFAQSAEESFMAGAAVHGAALGGRIGDSMGEVSGTQSINIAMVNTRTELRNFVRQEGRSMVFDTMSQQAYEAGVEG